MTIALALATTAASSDDTAATGDLLIQVSGYATTKGYLNIMVADTRDTFFNREKGFAFIKVKPQGPATRVILPGIPRKTYAIGAFHDENANNILDRTVRGTPKERLGFSNIPQVRNPPPAFDKAAFVLDSALKTVNIVLK